MKAVWLSSTYYFDEAVQALSPNAERMLTRGLAFCGNAETSGYITSGQINMLGLPNPKKLLKELVDGQILVPQPDGRWYFEAWPDWNSSGDALIARRKSDRERQARLRESKKASQPKSRDASQEKSRDVTAPEESREEQNSGHVPNAATDSTADEPRSAPVSPDAWKLVRQIIPTEHPPAVRTELGNQTSALLKAGTPVDLAADALRLWLTKNVHPKTLPALVSELINTRNRPTANGSRSPANASHGITPGEAKVLGWAELGNPNNDDRKAIER